MILLQAVYDYPAQSGGTAFLGIFMILLILSLIAIWILSLVFAIKAIKKANKME